MQLTCTIIAENVPQLIGELRQTLHVLEAQAPIWHSDVPAPAFAPDPHEHTLTPAPVVPIASPMQAPVAAPQTAPPAPVPTTVPDYTHEQLGRAVAAWIDKAPDNRTKALALLQGLGVQGVTQLGTATLRSAFALALREQGVQI